jgi:hypothetical protein
MVRSGSNGEKEETGNASIRAGVFPGDGSTGGAREGAKGLGNDEPGEAGEGSRGGTENTSGERQEKGGCVYFIETHDGAFVKIGYSIHVPRRFDEIGVLLPGLRLIGHMPGTMATERWLHGKFAMDRERGEWFRHTDEVRRFISVLGLIPAAAPEPIVEAIKPRHIHRERGSGAPMDQSEMASMGGKARAKKLTKAQRSESARAAVQARWAKAGTKKKAAARKAGAGK